MRRRSIKYFYILLTLSVFYRVAQGQTNKIEWFPKDSNFPLLEYELLETKPYFGLFLIKTDSVRPDGAYIPVNIGFRKPVLSWNLSDTKLNWILGVASYTQFNIERFDKNTLRGGLLNIDYKASSIFALSRQRHKFRLQVFHISSHLGDDFIIRNQYFEYNNKSVNYEQVDLTYLYSFDRLEIYIGLGEVFNRNAFRDRFMIQSGFQSYFPLSDKIIFSFGTDIKTYEENDFVPDIHYGFGLTIGEADQFQFNLLVDGYFGRLPYSTLDWGKMRWLGLSSCIYL